MNFFRGFILTFVVSLAAAATSIEARGGRAWGDFVPFVWWTAPFAFVLGLVFVPFFRAKKESSLTSRMAAAVVVGSILGGMWTILVSLLLGPWAALFSFPVGWCWIGAGAGVTFVACSMPDRSLVRMIGVAVSIVVVTFAVVYGFRTILGYPPHPASLIGTPTRGSDGHAF